MKKYSLNKNIYYVLGLVFIFIVWQLISVFFDDNSFVFPGVIDVFKETINILKGSYIYKCLFYTLIKMAIGFSVSILFAMIFGTVSGLNSNFNSFFTPFITLLKTVPTASLVFLFLVISGAKYAPIYIVILICFPILYESIVSGYENIDQALDDTLKLEKGNEITKIIKVRIPLCLPYLKLGVVSSLGLSFKIEIMAEILTGSTSNGLGSAINFIQKADPTNMTGIFAYSLIVIIIAITFNLFAKKQEEN